MKVYYLELPLELFGASANTQICYHNSGLQKHFVMQIDD